MEAMTHMQTFEYAGNGFSMQFSAYNNTIHVILTFNINNANLQFLPEDGFPEGLLNVYEK